MPLTSMPRRPQGEMGRNQSTRQVPRGQGPTPASRRSKCLVPETPGWRLRAPNAGVGQGGAAGHPRPHLRRERPAGTRGTQTGGAAWAAPAATCGLWAPLQGLSCQDSECPGTSVGPRTPRVALRREFRPLLPASPPCLPGTERLPRLRPQTDFPRPKGNSSGASAALRVYPRSPWAAATAAATTGHPELGAASGRRALGAPLTSRLSGPSACATKAGGKFCTFPKGAFPQL